ncbi:MAG: carboxypeptidase regulatory-like domain-containing protein [Myxococcales bacterium]|nr:carboxypeptidase regulatory-like domain-containing protein [Myxococcales bacterium]
MRWKPAIRAAADQAGRASVGVDPGVYIASVSRKGFATERRYLEVPAGRSRIRFDIELVRCAALFGRTVEEGSGAAVPFAELVAVPDPIAASEEAPTPEEGRFAASSDSRGLFRLDGLASGRYQLIARAVGRAPARTSVDVPQDGELRLELPPAATVEGIVAGPDGRRAAGAEVALQSAGQRLLAWTGPEGAFAAEVDPGSVWLSGRRGDEAGALAQPLVARAGEVIRGISIRLGAGAALEGAVQGPDGPAARAIVQVTPSRSSGEAARAVAGAAGEFHLGPLAEGTYDVHVFHLDWPESRLHSVTLSAGEVRHLSLAVIAPGAVAGRVTDGEGRPVPGALVSAGPPADAMWKGRASALSDSDGRYSLGGLRAGLVQLEARAEDGLRFSRRIGKVRSQATEEADFALQRPGEISGRILGELDARLVEVSLLRSGAMADKERIEVPVDSSGAFRSGPIEPGSYRIAAHPAAAGPGAVYHSKLVVSVEPGALAHAEVPVADSWQSRPPGSAAERGTIGAAFEGSAGGVAISWVLPTGPAAREGLRAGDLLIAIDGRPAGNALEAFERSSGEPGSKVAVTVRRDGVDRSFGFTREE